MMWSHLIAKLRNQIQAEDHNASKQYSACIHLTARCLKAARRDSQDTSITRQWSYRCGQIGVGCRLLIKLGTHSNMVGLQAAGLALYDC